MEPVRAGGADFAVREAGPGASGGAKCDLARAGAGICGEG
ncbi:hypothetical protein CCP3SC1AL1_770003 [Gammaproteobacteria bacterium]